MGAGFSLSAFFLPVMTPAYSKNRAYAIFFIVFTLIGKFRWVCRGHSGQDSAPSGKIANAQV